MRSYDLRMTLVLGGGTVYVSPSEAPRRASVTVEENAIAAVGDTAARADLDCSGCTIVPGFWNSHVHFFERQWAKASELPAPELARQLETTFLRYGFTTVFDLGSPRANTRALRERIESGEVAGPRIFTTGEGMVPPGAMPSQEVLNVMGVMPLESSELADVDSARAAAASLLDFGVDALKVFASAPRGAALAPEVLRAIADAAHGAGKLAFVHANRSKDVLASLQAGIDVIAHTTPASTPWELPELRGAALTPTLTLWRTFLRHDRWSVRERIAENSLAQLRAWRAAGGTVLFGTDLGAVDPDPLPEYLAMQEAGMSPREILTSLTTAPAARFGGVARIEAGAPADVVVLRGDPGEDVRALVEVRYVIRGARVVYRSEE